MARETTFPDNAAAFCYHAETLKTHWVRLHAGDAEAWPADDAVRQAWALFHAGDFAGAFEAGQQAGAVTVANKAQAVYANYVEKSEQKKLAMFLEVAERAHAQQEAEPGNAAAWYWRAYALSRYGQGISVSKTLAQGLGDTIKTALERTIQLAPRHADAHVALGSFHAEVIDKVGKLLGRTQGGDAATGLRMFREALKLNPTSASAMVAYANGLVMLEGDRRMQDADALYAAAAACTPLDAMERLDVDMAKAALDN